MAGRHVPPAGEGEIDLPRLYDRARAVLGLDAMPVIVADALAAQIDAIPDPDPGAAPESYPAAAYGTVAPPFRACFVEATTWITGVPVQRGMVVTDRTATGPLPGETVPLGTRWHVHLTPVLWSPLIGGRVETYGGATVLLHVSRDGRLLDDTARLPVHLAGAAARWPPARREAAARGAASIVPLVLQALAALHRRVPVEHVTPIPPESRAARRGTADAPERHSYYRLLVTPTAPTSRDDFARLGAPAPPPPRAHLVRGHFRWYGAAGLFGKHRDRMVWVPAHERGDPRRGRITKDYEVGADSD